MSKTIKQLCTFLLALCMAVSLFSTAILADENDWDKPCASVAYSDVIKTMWYHQAVDYVLKNNIIQELADKGPCVIIGRCGDYILRDREDVLRVFVTCDMPNRVERCVKYYGIP